MVELAKKWLLEYFADGSAKRPGDLEDDFCGEPGIGEMLVSMQGRWRESPFYPALGHLVNDGKIVFEVANDGDVFYALPGRLPSEVNGQAHRPLEQAGSEEEAS